MPMNSSRRAADPTPNRGQPALERARYADPARDTPCVPLCCLHVTKEYRFNPRTVRFPIVVHFPVPDLAVLFIQTRHEMGPAISFVSGWPANLSASFICPW